LVAVAALAIHLDGTFFAEERILTAGALPRILIGGQNTKTDSTLDQIQNRLHLVHIFNFSFDDATVSLAYVQISS